MGQIEDLIIAPTSQDPELFSAPYTPVSSFNPHTELMRSIGVTPSSTFNRWENESPVQLGNWPKVTGVLNADVRTLL